MKFIWTRVLVAVWASFMVATVGPVIFNGLFVMTAPVTCPGGKIDVQTDTYHPRPGETDTTFTPTCTPTAGAPYEIPVLASMAVIWAGALLPALIVMAVLPGSAFAWMSRSNRYSRGKTDWTADYAAPDHQNVDRLRELKQAYDAGLITAQEYDAKRQEIVKGM